MVGWWTLVLAVMSASAAAIAHAAFTAEHVDYPSELATRGELSRDLLPKQLYCMYRGQYTPPSAIKLHAALSSWRKGGLPPCRPVPSPLL